MEWTVFFQLAVFATAFVFTPGPANVLAMAAGAQWGLRACWPFLLGLAGGKFMLNTLMALGLLTLLNANPLAMKTLQAISAAYLLYLAWRVSAMRLQKTSGDARRLGFFAGLIVHPVNPKAWAISIAAFSQFINPKGDVILQSVVIIATIACVDLLAHPLWCFGGAKLADRIGGTTRERHLMRALAASLVAVVLWSALR